MDARRRLKVIRAEQGLTQAQLAEKLGVTREYLSNIERGKHQGSISLWLDIAKIGNIEGFELSELLNSVFRKGRLADEATQNEKG